MRFGQATLYIKEWVELREWVREVCAEKVKGSGEECPLYPSVST